MIELQACAGSGAVPRELLQGYECSECRRRFYVPANEEGYTCPMCGVEHVVALVGPFAALTASPAEGVAPSLEAGTYPQPVHGWTCFHCGETFTTIGAAADHFGARPESTAGCLIDRVALEEGGKPDRGRGLLIALRKAEAREAQLAADLAQVQVERDAYRAAALRCETENGTHCPEDRSCGETIEALKAQLAALRPYVQHKIECALFRVSVMLPDETYWRSGIRALTEDERKALKCSCGLAAILDPPAKETVSS